MVVVSHLFLIDHSVKDIMQSIPKNIQTVPDGLLLWVGLIR